MPDDPMEIVIREQLTIMGVDNAYHRAAAIALAVLAPDTPEEA